jgi:hypothetical protein
MLGLGMAFVRVSCCMIAGVKRDALGIAKNRLECGGKPPHSALL